MATADLPPEVRDNQIKRLACLANGRDPDDKTGKTRVPTSQQLEAGRQLEKLMASGNGTSQSSIGPAWVVCKRVDVSVFFGNSEDTIKLWLKQGCPGKRNHYNLKQIMEWRDANVGFTNRPDGNHVDASRAEGERRKSLADADMKEYRALVLKGELIHVDDVSREYTHSATHGRALFEQVPFRFMTHLVNTCPHCGEVVLDGDEKRRILSAATQDIDTAIEAMHDGLEGRIKENEAGKPRKW